MPGHRAGLVLHAERRRREKVDAGWVPPLQLAKKCYNSQTKNPN
jgi:hypothetical protein